MLICLIVLYNNYFIVSFMSQAWVATRRVSKDDWMEWVRRLSVELLKESPSPALRSCWALSNAYNPLARYFFSSVIEVSHNVEVCHVSNPFKKIKWPAFVRKSSSILSIF